jgi:hypothetical protein
MTTTQQSASRSAMPPFLAVCTRYTFKLFFGSRPSIQAPLHQKPQQLSPLAPNQ